MAVSSELDRGAGVSDAARAAEALFEGQTIVEIREVSLGGICRG